MTATFSVTNIKTKHENKYMYIKKPIVPEADTRVKAMK